MCGEISTTVRYRVMVRGIPVNTLNEQELLSYKSVRQIKR